MKKKNTSPELTQFRTKEPEDGFAVGSIAPTVPPESSWQYFRKHFYDTKSNSHLSPYEMFWIFFISAVLGAVIEQIFCIITNGYWERRTSLVYGEFGYAYAIGATLLTLLLFRNTKTEWWKVCLKAALVCSVAEYIMSWGEELVFGHVSWDYHNMPLNANGRICFLYGCFWGALGLFWAKIIYPGFKKLIAKIPKKAGKVLFWIFFIFLLYDTIISICATTAFNARKDGDPVNTPYEKLMERQFPNKFMIWTYPNSYQVKDGKVASDTLNGSNSKSNGGSLEDLTRDMTDRGFAIQQKQPSCISLGFAAKINQ